MKTTESLTKTERTLLLFLETSCVDFAGVYDPRRINDEDLAIMNQWKEEGFIDHGRIAFKFHKPTRTVWCKISPEAMDLAHTLRKERAERMWDNREWRTTAETR